jgi:hypothetical protein
VLASTDGHPLHGPTSAQARCGATEPVPMPTPMASAKNASPILTFLTTAYPFPLLEHRRSRAKVAAHEKRCARGSFSSRLRPEAGITWHGFTSISYATMLRSVPRLWLFDKPLA